MWENGLFQQNQIFGCDPMVFTSGLDRQQKLDELPATLS
jgi:hypothetical protein